MKYIVTLNEKKYEVEVERVSGGIIKKSNKKSVELPQTQKTNASFDDISKDSQKPKEINNIESNANSEGSAVISPMPGTVLDVKVRQGQEVKEGDVLFILEAMKMENEIVSEFNGTLNAVNVSKGDILSNGDVMALIG